MSILTVTVLAAMAGWALGKANQAVKIALAVQENLDISHSLDAPLRKNLADRLCTVETQILEMKHEH